MPIHAGLAAGSVRLLNQRESAPRELQFVAFELVQPFLSTVENSYAFLAEQGFSVVPHLLTKTPGQVIDDKLFVSRPFPLPADGLIVEYNDKVFGKSLGATGHHENCRIAFKWEDATHKTKFLGVRIRPTRSGILSLTALVYAGHDRRLQGSEGHPAQCGHLPQAAAGRRR